jgi:hopanoid biosynthesis associated protein HpnK
VKGLIVTADDFGAAREVNDAVERAHRDGILTAASLMVSAPAAADAVARARRMPSLRVGLHLVLAEGRPTLPASTIPDLVDASGNFRTDMARAGAAMFFRPRVRKQLAEEIAAQFEAFAATGLKLDHVNAHKHFHLHPTIATELLNTGLKHGMKAVRVPREPRRTIEAIEPGTTSLADSALAPFSALLAARFKSAAVTVPDQVFGLKWSGAMTRQRLASLVDNLPDGLSEIYLHPATAGTFAGSAPGYRYCEELEALLDSGVAASARLPGVRLGGFGDFPARR